MGIFILKPLIVGKLNLFSGMKYDALMHCEGLSSSERCNSEINAANLGLGIIRRIYIYDVS